MTAKTKRLIAAQKKKREAEGLSIRRLSSVIGVSFSTLARIERGEGEPDNNSLIRILEWLGVEGRESGLSFENVALVHFRASKNVKSNTIRCLLQAADILKRNYSERNYEPNHSEYEGQSPLHSSDAIALSKFDMELMAQDLRKDLELDEGDHLNALGIEIAGVDVYVPGQIPGLSEKCRSHLNDAGRSEWSAMSVPLDADCDRWAILRNESHNVERQRVTYLEECWHILLGHKLTRIAKVAESYGRTYDSVEEHDAYYLASACLLPKKAVTSAVNDQKSAEEIANHFRVSKDLVEYRIKRLGLWRVYKGTPIKLADRDGATKT